MATKRQLCVVLYIVILVLIAIATLNLFITKFAEREPISEKMVGKYVSIDFEVFGKVQGVFFRKHTQKKGNELKLVGWCKNTSKGSVVGQVQGEESKVKLMKDWLRLTGSPSSQIEEAIFKNEKELSELTFKTFDIVR